MSSGPFDDGPRLAGRHWCGAARELGGQQDCPIKDPCPAGTCVIAAGSRLSAEPSRGSGLVPALAALGWEVRNIAADDPVTPTEVVITARRIG